MNANRFLVRNRPQSAWSARIYIPKLLQPLFSGKTQLRKSTGHHDKRKAGRVALQYWAKCQLLFDDLEQEMTKKKEPTTFGIGYATTTDVLGRSHTFDFGGGKDPEAAKREREAVADVQQAAMATLEAHRDNPELIKALVSANAPPPQNPASAIETPMPWEELFTKYVDKERARIDDSTEQFNEETFNTYKTHRELWRDYFAGRQVDTIRRAEIQDIEAWLKCFPKKNSRKKLTWTQAIEKAKRGKGTDVISPVVYNGYRTQLAGLLKYAAKLGAHNQDLSQFIEYLNAKRGKGKRPSFSDKDMAAMFTADYAERIKGRTATTALEARFWVPLIAALSGARLNEICQLQPSDIKYDKTAECHYMNIIGDDELASDGKAKSVKNENSIRPVPIHPELIKIGFLDYVELMATKGGNISLFGLTRDGNGRFGAAITGWFTRKYNMSGFIERSGIESRGTFVNGKKWSKSFHSFRHTVTDNLRNEDNRFPDGSRIVDSHIALVLGHLDDVESKLETRGYGSGVKAMKMRRDLIALINYPSVDFESIMWPNMR